MKRRPITAGAENLGNPPRLHREPRGNKGGTTWEPRAEPPTQAGYPEEDDDLAGF